MARVEVEVFLEGGFVSWVKAESCSGVPDVCLDAARRGLF